MPPSDTGHSGLGRPPGRAGLRVALQALESEADDVEPAQPLTDEDQKEAAVQRAARARAARSGYTETAPAEESEAYSGFSFGSLGLLTLGTDLQQQIAQAAWKLRGAKTETVTKFKKLFSELLLGCRPTGSLTAQAAMLQQGRQPLLRAMQQAACYLVVFSAWMIGALLAALSQRCAAATGHKVVMLCVRRAYDETPSDISVTWMTHSELGAFNKKRSKQEGNAKVLQSSCEVLILMEQVSSSTYYSMRIPMPCWLMALDKTTAEATAKAQRAIMDMIPGLEAFGHKAKFNVQLVTTDRYSANLKAERILSSDAKTVQMLDGQVSGMIATALSCVDPFADEYRSAVFEAFLPLQDPSADGDGDEHLLARMQEHYLQRKRRRAIINFFLQGDLQEQDEIFFYSARWGLQEHHVLALMEKFLVPALLPRRPPIFSRTRWDGFNDALLWFGLAEACHGLLHCTLLDFLQVSASSAEWEEIEKTKQSQGCRRTFPVLEAARHTDLNAYRQRVNEAFHNEILLLPRWCHFRHHQVLLFRMLSRNLCSTEFLIGTTHESYPIKLFRSLDGVHEATKDPLCMHCPLTKLLLSEYSDLGSSEPQALLTALASMFQLHIASIEARHASTRRITTVKSVQTHRPTLVGVGADWVCRHLADKLSILGGSNSAQRAQFCRAVASSPASGADTEPPAQKQPERKNPWNAFLSEKCRARISDLGASYASLREEYHNLTPAEYQRYEDMAEVAFCARARGLPSYAHASLPAAAAASSSSGNDVAVEALVAVPAAGHQELAVPDKAYKLVSAELEDTLDMVQKDFRRRSASVKGLLSVGEKSTLRGMLFDKWERARRIRDASGNMVAQELSQAQQHQQTKLKSNRKLLDDGFVVVCLRPSSRAVPTEEVLPQKYMHSSWKALAMAAMNVRVEGGADSPSALWLHVGHINYTTWALGVLRLDEAGADEDRPEYLKLQVPTPQEYCHSVRMFEQSKLNFDGPWQFSVSTILSNNDVLERTSMRPDTVLVRQYAEVPSMEFWQGWPAEEARHEQNMKKRSGTSTRKRKKTPPSDTGTAKKKQKSAAGSARDTVEQPLPGGGPEEDLEQDAVDPAAQLDLLHDEEVRSEASSTPWSEYVADALEGEDPGDDGGLGAEASAAAEPEIHADSVDHVDAAEAAHPRAEPRPTTVVGFKSLGRCSSATEHKQLAATAIASMERARNDGAEVSPVSVLGSFPGAVVPGHVIYIVFLRKDVYGVADAGFLAKTYKDLIAKQRQVAPKKLGDVLPERALEDIPPGGVQRSIFE
ncbi:unnamed protein product, partial [Symbiodinium necroappetens]